MKRFLAWIALSLPWMVGFPLLAAYCRNEYLRGLHFEQGMHGFGWLLNLFVIVPVYGAVLLMAVVWIFFLPATIWKSKAFRVTAVLTLLSLAVPLAGLFAMSGSFFAGRDAAYHQLDHKAIYQASLQLAPLAPETGSYYLISAHNDNLHELPPVISQLAPSYVAIARYALIIQLDGGGPMYHEGLGIVFRQPANLRLPSEGIEQLSDELPVYMFRLSDFSMFLEAGNDEDDSP